MFQKSKRVRVLNRIIENSSIIGYILSNDLGELCVFSVKDVLAFASSTPLYNAVVVNSDLVPKDGFPDFFDVAYASLMDKGYVRYTAPE